MDEIRISPHALTPEVKRPDQAAPAGASQTAGAKATPQGLGGKTAEEAGALRDTARIAGQPTASLAELLPLSILQSPQMMRTEWAWRRLVIDAWMRQQGTDATTAAKPATNVSQPEVLQRGIQSLWQQLDHLSQTNAQASATLHWPDDMPQQPVTPFAALSEADTRKLPAQHKAGVVLDRLQGAAATPTDPRTGSGLFFPGLVIPQLPPGEAHKAVRWQAERQTRITKTGQIVYRLKVNLDVSGRPVEITFLSAKPSLSVHIKTPDHHLRRRIDQPDAGIAATLRALGWNVDNWSASEEMPGASGSSETAGERQGG